MVYSQLQLTLPKRKTYKPDGFVCAAIVSCSLQAKGGKMVRNEYMNNYFVPMLFVMVVILLQGCTHNISVKQDSIMFQDRAEKLPLNVGLFLTEETRNYIVSAKKTDTYNFMIGEALEASATESLKKVFQTVSVIHDKTNVVTNVDRIVSIKFGPASKFKIGATVFSETASTVELMCKVFDKEWNLLWEGTSISVTSGTTAGKLTLGLLFAPAGDAWLHKRFREMASESLIAALEKLNEQILSLGKEAILKTKE